MAHERQASEGQGGQSAWDQMLLQKRDDAPTHLESIRQLLDAVAFFGKHDVLDDAVVCADGVDDLLRLLLWNTHVVIALDDDSGVRIRSAL